MNNASLPGLVGPESDRPVPHAIVPLQRQREHERWLVAQSKRRQPASMSSSDGRQPADPHTVQQIAEHLPPQIFGVLLAMLGSGELLAFPHVRVLPPNGPCDGRDYFVFELNQATYCPDGGPVQRFWHGRRINRRRAES